MMVLTDKPEVGQTNATLLAKELTEIYSTPTPKGWLVPKKVSNFYLIDCVSFYNSRGPIFITGTYAWILLKHDSSQFFGLRENIPNLR